MKLAAAAVLAALAAPAAALAEGPTMTVRGVALHASRTAAAATPRFNMVGLHWRGRGRIYYRTRNGGSRWSAWRQNDDDDRVENGWHLGNLDWTGPATAIRFRAEGDVTQLRAYYVWSPPEQLGTRRLALANAPPIIPRASWGADEQIRRAAPVYAAAVHFAVVHHTAGSNDYTPAQSAAIVRGIEHYHVQGNGWNDIGYNFLVDRYGQIFEGRYGGVDRPVVGAHAQGFNDGSVGISVIGDYGSTQISAAARASLERLLAWRLDVAHVDPQSTFLWPSTGNPRFPKGVPVLVHGIVGHRDTGFTECPGNALYALLPRLAQDVAALGGPKVYAPVVSRLGEGQVRFTARLSQPRPWAVTVVDSSGAQVAEGTGTGTTVDWTWDSSTAAPDRYTWTIATQNARPATGTLGAVVALAVQKPTASPRAVAPAETTSISYTLTAAATVTVVLASATGEALATLLEASQTAGAQTVAFTPPPGIANGAYTVAITATAGARTATASIPLTVDDILTGFTLRGGTVSFTLTRLPLALSFEVLRSGKPVTAPTTPVPALGPQPLTWDGTVAGGAPAPDGTYTLALTVTDEVGSFTRTATVTVDTTPPRVTVLSYPNLRFRVSEPATLTLVVGSQTYERTLVSPGTTQFWLRTKPAAYRLVATDAAGNSSTVDYRR